MDSLIAFTVLSLLYGTPSIEDTSPTTPTIAQAVEQRLSSVPPRLPSPRELAQRSAQQDDRSPSFYRRLDVHRYASYAILPLFALQYAAGSQLYGDGVEADWARAGHVIGASGVAVLFATQLVTGIPNLIELRKEPRDRGRRLFHASAMLLASAGFTATGLLADAAGEGPNGRRTHRAVAISSMAVATIGYFSMLDVFRGN